MGEELGGGVLAAVVEVGRARSVVPLFLPDHASGPATITMPSSSWMNTRPGVPP